MVDFWATWCAPCRRTLPALLRLRERYADRGLEVIGVAEDEAPADATAFARAHGLSFPILWDEGKAFALAWNATATPSIFVVGKDGVVRFARVGDDGDLASLEQAVLSALSEDGEK